MQTQPASVAMIRKDSSMSHKGDESLDIRSPSTESTFSVVSTNSSNYKNKVATPWVPLPKVGRPISSPLSTKKSVIFSKDTRLHPTVAPFQPGGGPISFLNTDSEPDDTPLVNKGIAPTANIGRALRPIGSGSPPGSASSIDASPISGKKAPEKLHDGPAFSTDVDEHASGTRYVVIGNIPDHWAQTGILTRALVDCGIAQQLIAYQAMVTKPGFLEVVLWFDDLRHAVESRDSFGIALTTATFKFISHEEYFTINSTHPRAERATKFDGQIDFSTTFIGKVRDFDLQDIFKTIRAFAGTFGEIRTFALQEPCEIKTPRFRVEYFTISAADRACELGDLKEFIELGDDLLLDIMGYSPHGPSDATVGDAPSTPTRQVDLGFEARNGSGNPRGPAKPKRGGPSARNKTLVAPEYRQPRSRPFDASQVRRSGIHDLIDLQHVRASGQEHIRNQPQTVILSNIIQGTDCRTTVMVRNIPNKLDACDLKDWLDQTSEGLYDFSYLRVDFSNNCNVGYAFVNFSKPEYIVDFVDSRVGRPWGLFGSEKTCEVSYATIQGQDCLVAKFRNSSVMLEWEGFRPKVFYSVDSMFIPPGKNPGDQAPFPKPDNPSKLQRSLDNAVNIGLYPPRSHQRGRDNHPNNRRSQYDRGTPRALQEERSQENPVVPSNQIHGFFSPEQRLYRPDDYSMAYNHLNHQRRFQYGASYDIYEYAHANTHHGSLGPEDVSRITPAQIRESYKPRQQSDCRNRQPRQANHGTFFK
ncbi:hypothetical protein AAFC00_003393 [Neodothiora populina]|uniref:Mei2-like C-terminal RNA recognition motif domain-containing protein n=1 Tax=Neodothiora populina TaxID=2781224 RepID=A0ABR3PE13_9PEZI